MRWPAYLSIISLISRVARADLPIFTSSKEFDKGDYGRYVAQQYHSTSLLGPRPNMFDVAGSCGDDGLLVMMTLRGWAVEQAAPMIIDGRARLVWTGPAYVQPYNLQVQTYRGEQFLTFWAGDDGVKGHGSGFYYMVRMPGFSLRPDEADCLCESHSSIRITMKDTDCRAAMASTATFMNSTSRPQAQRSSPSTR